MILLSLIKKEIKQFFKCKSDVIIMLIFPIILIFVMGRSLNGLMGMDKNIFNNKVIYYRVNLPIEEEMNLQLFYDFMIHFEKSTNVKFIENKNYKEATNDVNSNKAICFMDIYDGHINYFRNENKETTESKIFRNLYNQYIRKYDFVQSNQDKEKDILNYDIKIFIQNEGINKHEVNSFTYYTFSILSLIILYISTLTSISMYKDRFLHTMTRMKVSNTKKINILISKMFLGISVGLLQIAIVYIYSIKCLHVYWGDDLKLILMVLISFIIFSSVLGIFMSMIFSNQRTCYMVSNMIIIIMGFLGGAYVPMCLVKSSRVTSFLSELMPNYWVNISLLSLNYNINTKYYINSILISLSLSVLMLIIGSIISKLKVGGSFD